MNMQPAQTIVTQPTAAVRLPDQCPSYLWYYQDHTPSLIHFKTVQPGCDGKQFTFHCYVHPARLIEFVN